MLGDQLVRSAARGAGFDDRVLLGTAAALTLLFAAADLATPAQVSFTAFYVLPVMLGCWAGGRGVGAALAVLSNVVTTYQQLREPTPDAMWVVAWNTMSRLLVLLLVVQLLTVLARALRTARHLAERDHLTGIANRRQFEHVAGAELGRARQDGRPFALVLLDVDGFKQLNDRHGHSVGDAALRALAGELGRLVRPGDLVARLGGDEFVVLLPGLGPAEAPVVIEDLRQRLAHSLAGHEHPLAVSVGAASYAVAPSSLADALATADRAMYDAKAARADRAPRHREAAAV